MRLSIWPSWHAHSGCALAATPSPRKRAMSSGWMTWMWAMWGRVSDGPFATRAASTASSASRTARSPMAWKCGWSPSASSCGTQVRRPSGSIMERPRLSVGRPSPPRYGSIIAPVKFSRTPSIISFTLVAEYRPMEVASRRADELLDLLGAAVALPPHRPDDPGRQLAARGERDVGALLRVGPDDRVLPCGDAERVQIGLGCREGRLEIGRGVVRLEPLHQVRCPFVERAARGAVRVALDAAVGRVRGRGGDRRPAPGRGC